MQRDFKEEIIEKLLLLTALIAVVVIFLIAWFIFREGLPLMFKVGLGNFLFGTEWAPTRGHFGIFTMIVGTITVTIGSLILGVPLGIASAIFMAEIAPRSVVKIVRPAVELLAGIPSVIYGLFGLVLVKDVIQKVAKLYFGSDGGAVTGLGIINASIILAIMILPTVISISYDALRSVPREYKEGSLALGATHWQTISKVLVPAASSGIIAGVVLGMGRAMGETMAVIMVAGNSPVVPDSIFSMVRTLTGNIAMEMGYASGEHRQALFATGVVLFIFIMLLNSVASYIVKRGKKVA